MKVDISHFEETRGMLFQTTYYGVECNVTFSEEELSIIETNKLEKDVVLERPKPPIVLSQSRLRLFIVKKIHKEIVPEEWFLYLGDLMKDAGDRYATASVREAKVYEQELVEALGTLKQYIAENAGIEEKSKSFEL